MFVDASIDLVKKKESHSEKRSNFGKNLYYADDISIKVQLHGDAK